MHQDLNQAAKEIFHYKELLKDVIVASMNTPEEYLDKVFPIYQEMVEMVETFQPFTIDDVELFLSDELTAYDEQPFFPVIAGLFLNALINKLFVEGADAIELNLNELCYQVIADATLNADAKGESTEANEVSFSLDFMGYLLPDDKILTIIGPVGDFAGALMGANSTLILKGMHGKHFGYEKHPTARIMVEN